MDDYERRSRCRDTFRVMLETSPALCIVLEGRTPSYRRMTILHLYQGQRGIAAQDVTVLCGVGWRLRMDKDDHILTQTDELYLVRNMIQDIGIEPDTINVSVV